MKRWHEETAHMDRQLEVVRLWSLRDAKRGNHRKRKALDCGRTKCSTCHGDKFPKREKTRQEIKADLKLKEEMADQICGTMCEFDEYYLGSVAERFNASGLNPEVYKAPGVRILPDPPQCLNNTTRPKNAPWRKCETCGASTQNKRFCNRKCTTGKQKIVWPKNLIDLVKESSKTAVAKKLGVSDKTVAKRLRILSR